MQRRGSITSHNEAVLCAATPTTGAVLATGGEDGRIYLTEVSTFLSKGSIKLPGDVTSVRFRGDSTHELYASCETSIFKIDLRKDFNSSEAICGSLSPSTEEINCIDISNSGRWLAAADDSGEIQMLNLDLWDTPQRAQRTLRRGHSNLTSTLRFFPGSEREVISGGADCRLVHWNAARLQQVRVIDIPTETSGQGQMWNPPMLHDLEFVPGSDGHLLNVACGDGTVGMYKMTRPSPHGAPPSSGRSRYAKARAAQEAGSRPTGGALPGAHFSAATAVTWVGQDVVVSGGNDGQLILRRPVGYTPTAPAKVTHGEKVNALCALSPTSLVVTDVTPTLTVYELTA